MGRSADVGSPAPGHSAGMVAVRGDRVRDVRVLEQPTAVLKRGVAVALD